VQLLTVGDVARMLHMSRSKIYAIKDRIGYYKLEGDIRFREEDIVRYLDERRVGGNGQWKPAPRPRLRHIKV
jgi:hypothetical protein